MLISTIETIPGKSFQVLGLVQGGITVFLATRKMSDFFRQERTSYTEDLQTQREVAIQRMSQAAAQMGADAVVGVRFEVSAVSPNGSYSDILAYGTAVKFDY